MKLVSEDQKKGQSEFNEAIRYDFGKLRLDLIPYDTIEKVAEVFTHGAIKYGEGNWRKGFDWSRIYGSLFRHLFKAFRGEDIDEDSGCLHLAMAAWGCLVLMNYLKEGIGKDDREVDIKLDEFELKCYKDIEKQEKLFIQINSKLLEKKSKPNVKSKDDINLMNDILDKLDKTEISSLIRHIVKDTLDVVEKGD